MARVIVPHRKLSAKALAAVAEEYVTRDGTELTDATPKTATVVELLDRDELVLVEFGIRSRSGRPIGFESLVSRVRSALSISSSDPRR